MPDVQEKLQELNEAYVNCQLLVEKHKRFIKDLREQLKDLIGQIEGVKDAVGHE
jgi:uncharacterized coiled-coil protein SlyX